MISLTVECRYFEKYRFYFEKLQWKRSLCLTTVELQLVVEIKQLPLDVRRTRTVVAHAEGQQHVDLKHTKKQKHSEHFQCVSISTGPCWKSNLVISLEANPPPNPATH